MRINIVGIVSLLQREQTFTLVSRYGENQAGMLPARRIHFETVELDDLWNGHSRLQQCRIGLLFMEPRQARRAVIGRDHPSKPEFAGHFGIGLDRINAVGAKHIGRDVADLRAFGVIAAEAAMNMMIAREPCAAALRECGRERQRADKREPTRQSAHQPSAGSLRLTLPVSICPENRQDWSPAESFRSYQ